MKVWITKFALTQGVFTAEAEVCDTVEDGSMIQITRNAGGHRPDYSEYYHRNDWHTSSEDAAKRADEMRVSKIRSLKKQIGRLEQLTFTDGPST